MKRRLWLAALLCVCVVFGTAASAYAKSASRIKFYGTQQTDMEDDDLPWHYAAVWPTFDTTSAPDPVAKARLSRYSARKRAWVGYARQPVKVYRWQSGNGFVYYKKLTTDSKGYMRHTLMAPGEYKFVFKTNRAVKGSSNVVLRVDSVPVTVGSSLVTSAPADAGAVKYTVTTQYRYNPYFAAHFDDLPVLEESASVAAGGLILGSVYNTHRSHFDRGTGYSQFSFLLPADVVQRSTGVSASAQLRWERYFGYVRTVVQ